LLGAIVNLTVAPRDFHAKEHGLCCFAACVTCRGVAGIPPRKTLAKMMNQSINQSIILFSNAGYIKAAIRLMWTYNKLIKCETKIIYKITLWYLNIQYESLK